MSDLKDFKNKNTEFTGTSGIDLPEGTTAQQVDQQGRLRFNTDLNLAEYYDGVTWKTIDSPPTVSSISPSSFLEGDFSTVQNAVLSGVNFDSAATIEVTGADGTVYTLASSSIDSGTQISLGLPTSISADNEPYKITVTNPSGLSGVLTNAFSINDIAEFGVAAGSLGTLPDDNRSAAGITTITATDEESDAFTFQIVSGTLPSGITFNSDGTFSGTAAQESVPTTYNFTVKVIDSTNPQNEASRDYSITVIPPIDAHYLIVGGGGGSAVGGGGGGGFRTSYGTSGANSPAEPQMSLTSGATYTITVGAGGQGDQGSIGNSNDQNGDDSSVIGTGVSITSLGGGEGSDSTSAPGNSGASGGGGHGGWPPQTGGGSGTANQGNPGGSGAGVSGSYASGGGGGGAGASGGGASSGTAGSGGSGLSSSITGSSITYAGGGGGGGYNGTSGGPAGSGGGAAGGGEAGPAPGSGGTPNTGGGGGGAYAPSTPGGSGVVILRLATALYTGTTTGSPTVTTDGSDTVVKFTGSGSYTA